MLYEAERAGLAIDPGRKAEILGGAPPWVPPDPASPNQHESLRGLWWLAEIWPKVDNVNHGGGWVKRVRLNLARRRWIPPDARFHESVQQRLQAAKIRHRPTNLPEDIKSNGFVIPPQPVDRAPASVAPAWGRSRIGPPR